MQFNSLSKPFIVLTEIFFSVIGVLLGFAITGMTLSTIMVALGIVGLAGIVVKNAILLIEFTDELRHRGMKTKASGYTSGKDSYHPRIAYGACYHIRIVAIGNWIEYRLARIISASETKCFHGW